MNPALPSQPPEGAILPELRRQGCLIDCYALQVPARVTQAQFVEAFYTTPLFKVERFFLKLLAWSPSSDHEARELAEGTRDGFAVWKVSFRSAEQLLLRAHIGRSSSWLMAVPEPSSEGQKTTLFFGTVVAGRKNKKTGQQEPGMAFHTLFGLHDMYSRLLLQAAANKLAPLWA